MKLFNKIKAFFQYRGQQAELDVSAAEIKNGRVYLHTEEEPPKVYCLRSNTVEIFISPCEDISEEDLEILDTKKKEDTDLRSLEEARERRQCERAAALHPMPLKHFTPKMKTITFSMYPEEYDMLVSNMKENGYKKTEFLLACVSSAKKNSMHANYQRYEAEHKERRKAERLAAREAQQEELLARQRVLNNAP